MTYGKRLAAIAVIAAVAAGTAAVTATATSSAAKSTVSIKLGSKANEFALVPSARSVHPGAITFVVHNGGTMEHEFVVLKTATPAAKLPMSGGRAAEKGDLGEIESVKPGQTKKLTLTLKASHYALICNLPGHYVGGQHSDFTVK